MSQSDYLRHKRLSSILKTNQEANDLEAVLSGSDYTKFKQYTIVNSVKNTLPTKNKLSFDIESQEHLNRPFQVQTNITECPDNFVVCNNTQNRFNRRTNTEGTKFRGYKQHIPLHQFRLYRKKQVVTTEFAYPVLDECDECYDINKYFFLKDQRPYDSDSEAVEIFIG